MTMLQEKQWKEVLIFSNYHYKNVIRLHYVGFCSSRFGVFYDRIFEFLTLCVNSGPNRGVKAMHIPAVAIQSHDSIDFRKVFAASRASGDISINSYRRASWQRGEVGAEYMARVVHPKQHWASHWVRCGPMLGAQRLCGLRVVGNFRIPCSFSHPADAQCYCHTSLGRRIIKSYRSVPARAHRILSFMRLLIIYSRFGLRFASHGSRIRIAPALLAFSSAVGWVSGVRFDGEPPRVSVCISAPIWP